MDLQSLPSEVLDHVGSYLKYEDLLGVRRLCSSLRSVCLGRLTLGMTKLPSIVRGMITAMEHSMEDMKREMCSPNSNCENVKEECIKFIQFAIRHGVLRVLDGEIKMIDAVCGRYTSTWNFVSRYVGHLMDEFYRVIWSLNSNKTLEPEIASELFHLNDKFLRHFVDKVEPELDRMPVPYGVKVVDILNCLKKASFKTYIMFNENRRGFVMDSTHTLKDVGLLELMLMLDALPTWEEKMESILKALRSFVRWNNFYTPLKEIWSMEDAAEAQGLIGLEAFRTEATSWWRHNLNVDCIWREGMRGGDRERVFVSFRVRTATSERSVVPLEADLLRDPSPGSQLASTTEFPPSLPVPPFPACQVYDSITITIVYPSPHPEEVETRIISADSRSGGPYTITVKS